MNSDQMSQGFVWLNLKTSKEREAATFCATIFSYYLHIFFSYLQAEPVPC